MEDTIALYPDGGEPLQVNECWIDLQFEQRSNILLKKMQGGIKTSQN